MADLIPKERYISREFLDLEMERLWPRVWQIACREEEIPNAGDYVEYDIGDQSILVVRGADGSIGAYYNACLHRGTKLGSGVGSFAEGRIKCSYHGWCYDLSGCVTSVPDREEFPGLPLDLRLGALRVDTWGGFVFVNMDLDAEPLLDFLDPIPKLLSAYRLDEMRFRAYRTLVLPANWKAVLDAFNEGYHVQGAHPQILPWTDDVSIAYEQYETHARYGRLENARRELRGSPRLGDAAGVDEGEILAGLVAGLGGAFLKDEKAVVDELRAADLPPGAMLSAFQERRMRLLAERGFDTSAFTPDRMTSAEDVYWFPNMVGPIYPGSALLFRMRPNGLDPDSCLKDVWVLEWRPPGDERPMPERRFYPDWTAKEWDPVSTQDYENLVKVQAGMHSRGFEGLRLNERQEGNIAHMHRVLDRYLSRS
ncbi:MAG: aromatic ring-hydroxylating dioxygenase subunit alpha [Acidimicrobiia bacterium]|nr:aromatic ring-hydroxylating dioxygenase subunit alpha [Acidimicrobiia bacterium]